MAKEENKNISISSKELQLKNRNNTLEVGTSKAGFYHFTKASTCEKILNIGEKHYFYLNPLSKMNDLNEAQLHKGDGDSTFALCFCNSDTENIPMWYLYGGITGEGARIKLTANRMQDFIQSISCVYTVENGKINRKLEPKLDYTMEYGWVFYRESKERIKYRNSYYQLTDTMESFQENNCFVKDYEWKYEREFRIIFHIYDVPPEKIAIPIDKNLCMRNNGLSITLSPETKDNQNDSEEERKREASRCFGIPEKNIKLSTLHIKMDLLGRNREGIVDNFSKVIDGLEEKHFKQICTSITAQKMCSKDGGNNSTDSEIQKETVNV